MHCLLGDGLNTACDSTIDRLPKSPNASKYRNGHRCETNKLLSFIKIYISKEIVDVQVIVTCNNVWNYLFLRVSTLLLKCAHTFQIESLVAVTYVMTWCAIAFSSTCRTRIWRSTHFRAARWTFYIIYVK